MAFKVSDSRMDQDEPERGSRWHRWDLHFHTPSSFDYQDGSVTNDQIVDRLIAERIRVVAITDHHTIDVERINDLVRIADGRITFLPGIELRDDHGGHPIHYICIFSEQCDLSHVWDTLKGRLGLTPAAIMEKGGDERVYVPIGEGAKVTRELGGVVSIHAGKKSNSIENIRNEEQFQQQIKYDITKNHVDIMEIGQIKDVDIHYNVIFPKTNLDRPLVLCSDNHKIDEYAVKAPLWLRADPTFRGLRMVIREPRDRVYIGSRPPSLARVDQNRTKYIRSVSYSRLDGRESREWFSGKVEFNHGLVAIVGNKGSGKSALADTLGLLGSSKKSDSFSFLSDGRFRHPNSGYASQYEATLEWESGESVKKCLNDKISSDEVERIKYLPQDHVEQVCNEIVGGGEEGFEQELRAVIFSHVPEEQRLGQKTLDDLIRYQSGEKQRRIDSLQKQLRELSRSRAVLESKADPAAKRELMQKIKRKEDELKAHDAAKPEGVPDPATVEGGSIVDPTLFTRLEAVETEKKGIVDRISEAKEGLRNHERRSAVASRLLERIENFRKDFEVFKGELRKDASELGIDVNELVTLRVERAGPESVRNRSSQEIQVINDQLSTVDPPGLRRQLETLDENIVELQSQLDAPNRAYQAYLKELAEWEERRKGIEGDEETIDSLKGLRAALEALGELPPQIEGLKRQQTEIAREIHAQKVAQAEVFRNLYRPVQQFIDSHELAKDKLKLEFRAELVEAEFPKLFLEHLALNRKGSFMLVEDGRARAEEYSQTADWNDIESVQAFLDKVDGALHKNLREPNTPLVQLKDQLSKGKKPEDVFNFLYGLDFIRPRYVLRWEDKDLSLLSPGERGTLLLVFYLLIDKGDMPLVIDQPEGNLDNHTVAKVLVDCIKEARKRRQVFIVTHNPNLAVVCDADQIIHASMDKEAGYMVTYASGALENPSMSQFVTDVLEGTRWAFDVRSGKYSVT